jgi:hypothetical protein
MAMATLSWEIDHKAERTRAAKEEAGESDDCGDQLLENNTGDFRSQAEFPVRSNIKKF